MDERATQARAPALAPPDRAEVAGTRLVHYGPLWDADLDRARQQNQAPVALLVCHGMGQQVRYETISSIAESLRTEAAAEGATVQDVQVNLSKLGDSFLARAEITWTEAHPPGAPGRTRSAHVYEAYWAPLTEGRVTYWDAVKFLFSASWNGIRYSHPFGSHTFQRWLFGSRKTMRIGRATFFGICCVLVFLLVQIGIIGFVLTELARQYKTVLAEPISFVHLSQLHTREGLWTAVCSVLRWAGPFFPGHTFLIHEEPFSRLWLSALVKLILWFLVVAEAFFVRYFIIEYVGDVAAYISPYKDSKFDELRQKIQKVGLDAGKIIYGFGPPNTVAPRYDKLIMVGHSLGSVLAYDTLNALINFDNVSTPREQRQVVARTRALVTFGSPLDKTAFIFRMQAHNDEEWIREQCAASVQPLIVDYQLYRPAPFEWINIWSPRDVISGELNYYDDPARPANRPPCIQNSTDPNARTPFYAHLQYWGNPLLRRQLYRLVTS